MFLLRSISRSEKTERVGKVITALCVAYVSAAVIRVTLLLDLNKHVYNHKPGRCRSLKTSGNATAYLEPVEELNVVFIAGPQGILSLSTEDAKAQLHEIRIQALDRKSAFAKPLRPQALSAWVERGRVTLYVLNGSATSGQSVEVFHYKEGKRGEEPWLVHLRSVTDTQLYGITDIATIDGGGRFLLARAHYTSRPWLKLPETLMQFHSGTLLLYDSKTIKTVYRGLQMPTGLAWDPKLRNLYVSQATGKSIKVLRVERDYSVKDLTEIPLMTSPQHMYLDHHSGDLWASAHPVYHKTLLHTYWNASERSPSHVLRIRFHDSGGSWVITEPLANDGSGLSMIASVALSKGQMLVGTHLGKLVSCQFTNFNYA